MTPLWTDAVPFAVGLASVPRLTLGRAAWQAQGGVATGLRVHAARHRGSLGVQMWWQSLFCSLPGLLLSPLPLQVLPPLLPILGLPHAGGALGLVRR